MPTLNCHIRPEIPADAPAIHALLLATFRADPEARLVQTLRETEQLFVSLVAVVADQVVGHIAFSPVTLSPTDIAGGVGLAPLAVLPSYQQHGIGGQLVRAGLAACTQAGYAFAVVLGDPRYYMRFGFVRASEHGLSNEYGVDAEFMVQPLRPGGLPTVPGMVCYAPAFVLFA